MNKASKQTSWIHSFFIDWNVYISICSVSLLYYFHLISEFPFPFALYVFLFCSTFLSYNLLRNTATFQQIFSNKIQFLWKLTLLSFLGVIAFFYFTWTQILAFGAIGFLTFIYKFPFVLKKELRQFNYLKIFIISFVWVAGAFVIPSFPYVSYETFIAFTPLFLAQFLFFIAITLPFDDADQLKDNFLTIPKKIGLKRTKIAAIILLISYLIINLFYFQNINYQIAHGLVFIFTAAAILFYSRKRSEKFLFYIIDGTILFQTIIVAIFHRYL